MKDKNDICKMLVELVTERNKVNDNIRFCIDNHHSSSAIELYYKDQLEILNFIDGKISALHWVLE